MTTRSDQKEQRREEILFAGLDLFIRKGFTGTKVKDIADRVGMSVGLLFHYYASKEALYEELIRYGISGPMQTMAPTTLEPLAFFEATAEQVLSYVRTQPFVAKMFVLMGQAMIGEDVPIRAKALLQGFDVYTPTARLIRQGQENGTIRSGDPMALALAFWCAIQGVAQQHAASEGVPCPESEWIVDIIRNNEHKSVEKQTF
jgi:AcrR family transcriptional regulator